MVNKSFLVSLISVLSALCCAACSHEAVVSQSAVVAPMPAPVAPSSMAAPVPRQASTRAMPTVESAELKQMRVQQWFAKYDDIRHAAQMTPSEKSNAHRLGTAALTGNIADRQASVKLLTELSGRYKSAQKALDALAMMPETAELQLKYSKYFQTGESFCDRYCKQLNKSSDPKVTIALLEESQRDMAMADVSNKVLDRTLRKKFDIAAYKWD